MKLARIERLETCADGTGLYACHFDQPWTRQAIHGLAPFGELDYFADFPRPYYRVRGASGIQVNGVEGLKHCRVLVPAGRAGSGFQRELEAWWVAADQAGAV